MSFIKSILKVFVGDKSDKEIKKLQPYLSKIKTFEASLMKLSDDVLRARTLFFKEQIQQARIAIDSKISTLKQNVESIEDVEKKENLFIEIDAIKKEGYELAEKTLMELLPEAFAVVKETARRFKDEEFARTKPYVSLVGDQAI